MRSSTGLLVVGGVLAVAAAGWLVVGGLESSGAVEGFEAEHTEAGANAQGPMLTGQGRALAPAAPTVEGEFRIPGKVVDGKGQPLAGMVVNARRRGEAYATDDPRRWGGNAKSGLDKAFDEVSALTESGKPDGIATSAADGTFTVLVFRRGDYGVRAEPEGALVSTEGSWYLNDVPPVVPLTLRVLSGSPLKGRVVDAQDRGVAAIVRGYTTVQDMAAWRFAGVRTEAGTGAFAFPAAPIGKILLDVAVPGRLRLTGRAVTIPHEGEVVIRIEEGSVLARGHVRDLQGAGIAGARVIVTLGALFDAARSTEALMVKYFATADAEGAYAIAGPLGGPVGTVEAAAPGYLYTTNSPPLATWSGLELATGREAVLDLTLWKGGVVDGRATEKGSGSPLANVEIQLLPAAVDGRITRPSALLAITDALGRYHVDGVPVGRSVLVVKHPTHYLAALEALPGSRGSDMFYFDGSASAAAGPPADLTVFVAQEGERVVRDLELVKGVPLAGRVVDSKGASVEGAQVFARGLGLGNVAWSWGVQTGTPQEPLATSDAEGRFTVPGLPPRKDWVLFAKKAPLIGEVCAPFTLSADATAPTVLLKLVGGCTVAGKVLDDRGNAVAGAQVYAWSQQADAGGQVNANQLSGEDGSFRFEGLGKGQLQLHASAPGKGYANQMLEGMAPGEVREGLELKFSVAVELAGTLVDENGQPARFKPLLAQAMQTGNNDQTTSAADGSFKFGGATAGQVRISAGDWQNNVELTTVTAPARDLRVTWKAPPQQVIEGMVLDAQGKPVPLCTVAIRPESQPQQQVMYWDGNQGGGTVVNGWFRRNAQGKPPFKVEVSGPQDAKGNPLNLKGKTATVADPAAGPITITLEPGLSVAGKVLDAGGRGVEGVALTAGKVRATTDRQGWFELGGMAEGNVAINVVPPSPWVRPAPVTAVAGATDVVVHLRSGVPIAGEVRGQGGKPIANGWVQAGWAAVGQTPGGNAHANIAGEGRFRIEGIPEEAKVNLNVQVWSQDGNEAYPQRTIADVRPGTEDLVIDMAGGVSIEGFVVDTNGKAFSLGYVMVTTGTEEKGQNTNYVQIQGDGTFKAPGLERGPVKLGLWRNDGGPTGETVTVDAPATQVKLVLPAATPIRGTLSGTAPQTFRVWAWTTGENRRQTRAVTPGADGKFSLEGVSGAGQWMVGARARSGDSDLYALAGPFAGGAENVSLELRTGRSIEGTVVTGDGTDVPAETFASAFNDVWTLQVKVGARGEFRIRGLPPGRYTVQANTQDGTRTATQADVEDGVTSVRLTLRASGG